MRTQPQYTFLLLSCHLVAQALCGSFVKVGSNPGSTYIQINNVGVSEAFNPKKFSNWQYDIREPLIPANDGGSCNKNIYNPNVVQNGGAWNVYFGGWDGVSSCHDSVSVTVSLDNFRSFNPHSTMIATGGAIHVNNPSAIKVNETTWYMVTTQLGSDNLNKPGISVATNGIDWNPNQGGIPSADIFVNGYPGWEQADVNGGNDLIFDPATGILHFFFVDFQKENQHSVFHAISKNGDIHNFDFVGISLGEPDKVIDDIKFVNGKYVMGIHFNGPTVFYSVSNSLFGEFPTSVPLFSHRSSDDKYIVSIGFVSDEISQKILGAFYGAGPVPTLDQNEIYAAWLQKRVLFMNNDTIWGIGDASRAFGPETVFIATNQNQLVGNFYLYGEDYIDLNNRGTLLHVSPTEIVQPGDIWEYSN